MVKRPSESGERSPGTVSGMMMKALVAFACSCFAAAAADVLAGGGNVMKPEAVEAEMKKLGRKNFYVREKASKEVKKAAIDVKGLEIVRAWTNDPDLEVKQRAKDLFSHHKPPFIEALFRQYDGKTVMARNSSVPVWMWHKGIEKHFTHPPHFEKFKGWAPRRIEQSYTDNDQRYIRQLPTDVAITDINQRAAQYYARERLKAASEYFVGLPDATGQMEKDFMAIRTMFEQWAIIDNDYRKELRVPHFLIPIPEDKKISSLSHRERLSLTLNGRMDRREIVLDAGEPLMASKP